MSKINPKNRQRTMFDYVDRKSSKLKKVEPEPMEPEVVNQTTQPQARGGEVDRILLSHLSRTNTDVAATAAPTEETMETDIKLQYEERKGDLFSCKETSSLAHCIAADVKMGRGVAKLFKKRFGRVQDIIDQGQRPGGCAFLEVNGRYIYYLVIKETYQHKPTYDNIKSSLQVMNSHCEANNVPHVCMPKIGCGLDGLQWPKICELIHEVFSHTDIKITIYSHEDAGAAAAPVAVQKDIKLQYEERKGDLFSCEETSSLAHCIAANVNMQRGVIANRFKKRFGRVAEIVAQGQRPGGCAFLKVNGRYIYYLVIKERYEQKPTYDNIKSSLQVMNSHCEANNVSHVCMPKIGYGLQWPQICELIHEVFSHTDIKITVYSHEDTGGGGAAAAAADQKGLTYEEKKGDLFSCEETSSLAHCISEDVRMGKGIAVLFKKKFGRVGQLMDQGQRPGGCAVLKVKERYVYYLVTKEKYWQKPTYGSLKASLQVMNSHCEANNVQHLCMPKIGCGLDGLQWPKVVDLIHEVFARTDIKITIYTM